MNCLALASDQRLRLYDLYLRVDAECLLNHVGDLTRKFFKHAYLVGVILLIYLNLDFKSEE